MEKKITNLSVIRKMEPLKRKKKRSLGYTF